MRYFDTSILIPLVMREASSDQVSNFLAALPFDHWSISDWTTVEFASFLARAIRMDQISARDAVPIRDRFQLMIEESFMTLLPSRADYRLARDYLAQPNTGLRAGDALHLAIAANNAASDIHTLDKTMLKVAMQFGLPISTPL